MLIGVVKMSDKKFICEHCGKVITEEEINNDLLAGGMGLCDCEYIIYSYDGKRFEPLHLRIYNQYHEIPEDIYKALGDQPNESLRLKMYYSYLGYLFAQRSL